MSKLSDEQRGLLRLLLRSAPTVDGWYPVSSMLWPAVSGMLPDDLAEKMPDGDSGFLRLTERGQAVADYT